MFLNKNATWKKGEISGTLEFTCVHQEKPGWETLKRNHQVARKKDTRKGEREASRRGYYIPWTKSSFTLHLEMHQKSTPHGTTNSKWDTGR